MAEIYGFAINIEGNAVKSITAIDQKLSGLNTSAQKSDSVFSGLFKFEMFKQAGSLIFSAGKSIIDFGIQTEQTRTAFDVMLGSVDKGRDMFESLKQWADVTPFDNDTAYQAGRQLLNYGVAAKDIIPYMSMLGDASGGVKSRFDSMAYAFGQVRAAGKLQGQDLRQLIDAGFNPLQEMSQMTGKSMSELKKQMEGGNISFEMMVGAFKHATTEGGRFAGMMDKQSQTVGGLFSTVAGTAQTAMYGMFQRMSPMLKEIATASIEVAQSFADWVTPKQSDLLSEQRTEMTALFEVLKNGNLPLDQRRDLINKINTEYKDYIPYLITEKTSVSDIAVAQGVANGKMLEKIQLVAKEEVLTEYAKKATSAQKELMQAQIELDKAYEMDATKEVLVGGKLYTDRDLQIKSRQTIVDQLTEKAYKSQKEYEDIINKLNQTHQPFFNQPMDGLKTPVEITKSVTSIDLLGGVIGSKNQNEPGWLAKQAMDDKFSNDLKTKGFNAVYKNELNKIKAQSDALTSGTVGGRAFTDNAASTSALASGGGLGQAKTINMNFNQPLMQINAGSIDGQDMNDNAEKVIEELTRQLFNITNEQGVM
jgi:tape measure domain-containing protein